MPILHISEADAIRDFAGVLARVRAGEEVVIGAEDAPIAVLKSSAARPGRLISESLRMANASLDEVGQPAMDSEFADDMQEILGERESRNLAED